MSIGEKPIRKRWPVAALAGGTMLCLALASCNFAVKESTPTPTATNTATATATGTATATPSVTPTASHTPTITPTPSVTPTPSRTPLPTTPPTPSATPYPVALFANDQWAAVTVPEAVSAGLQGPHFAIASANERTGGATNPETPVPAQQLQTLYLVDPARGTLIEVFDLPAGTQGRIYWAPDGRKLAYFLEPALRDDGVRVGGLYLLNIDLGISLRLFNIPSLDPRGIPDHAPVWAPDSSKLAVALPTAYDVDIYVISSDGSAFQNVTGHGSYDLWPAWSPDSRRLAFISDRADCPTWTPGEAGSCSQLEPVSTLGVETNSLVPRSGNLHVLELESGRVQQVSELTVDGPPQWVSNLQVAVTVGLSDVFAAQSGIYLLDSQAGTSRRVSGAEPSLDLGAAWAPGGVRVVYHRASDPPAIVLRDARGNEIVSSDQYLFPRFGFTADWSPGGERVTFGGHEGQCPYGLVVASADFSIQYAGSSPGACDPSFSPDGAWLAYAGVQTRTGAADGRLDLYIGSASGYGGRNYTSSLKGEIRLLGWVGSSSS